MKSTRLFAIVALLIMLCIIFVACGEKPTPSDPTCDHSSTTLVGAKAATCNESGYTGDLACVLLSLQREVKFPNPNTSLTREELPRTLLALARVRLLTPVPAVDTARMRSFLLQSIATFT